MVVLDTNIIVDHLRQEPRKTTLFVKAVKEFSREALAVSIVSIQELYEGQSTKDVERERKLLLVLSSLQVLPYTYEIAKFAGEIARDLPKPIGLADATIAATAITNGASLLTLNKKDFSGILGLELE